MIRATHITKRLRGILNAWHFHYALVLVIKVVCGGIGIALPPLNRALYRNQSSNLFIALR
ncbi:TPA: DUF3265 domain-containing protein [Vibrio parahaemolyticus]|nr:DUF3265 domain-containing protein [Vibrio parahaemolyticus]